ncbi:hypothetical protein [Vreelandella sp. V005]|uniref:hypothetical protein n=1 Tax=Vreelandella sp. V005 TaxID=3459608 RepID=UPI004044BB6D
MRLTPWFLTFAMSAALLTTAGYTFADNHESEGEQHKPLDDQALEEEYGIKAGSVKREEEVSSSNSDEQVRVREEEEEEEKVEEEKSGEATRAGEDDVALEPGKSEERSPAAGTGGTGSPEDAIHSSEEENSDKDNSSDTDDSE